MKYYTQHNGNKIPPSLMITSCEKFNIDKISAFNRTQMWECPESDELLKSCKYQVCATDMMAGGLAYKDRAELDMDFMETLLQLYPSCKAIYFKNSGKLFTAQAIREREIPRDGRFVYFAVNVRSFNIEGTNDILVDSVGMSTLFLPDLQYHFHEMNQDDVINHAYNTLLYIFNNDNPIKSGDTIDGSKDGHISRDIQWTVRSEKSLIQPIREVLDIRMGEYSSGKYDK